MSLPDIQFDYGPDSDRETELKRQLVDLQERYRREAQPILDDLAKEHALKTPRITMLRERANVT